MFILESVTVDKNFKHGFIILGVCVYVWNQLIGIYAWKWHLEKNYFLVTNAPRSFFTND